jgi:hypothetical protein
MTETLEQEIATTPVPPPHKSRPPRVYQAAAWVAIVAGVVFIVGAVFFTGFALGRHSGGGHGWQHRGHSEMGPRMEPMMPGMRPGGPMGPEDMGPMGPGMRPENPPQSAPPAPPAPRP